MLTLFQTPTQACFTSSRTTPAHTLCKSKAYLDMLTANTETSWKHVQRCFWHQSWELHMFSISTHLTLAARAPQTRWCSVSRDLMSHIPVIEWCCWQIFGIQILATRMRRWCIVLIYLYVLVLDSKELESGQGMLGVSGALNKLQYLRLSILIYHIRLFGCGGLYGFVMSTFLAGASFSRLYGSYPGQAALNFSSWAD